jgi:hypothetical protein
MIGRAHHWLNRLASTPAADPISPPPQSPVAINDAVRLSIRICYLIQIQLQCNESLCALDLAPLHAGLSRMRHAL